MNIKKIALASIAALGLMVGAAHAADSKSSGSSKLQLGVLTCNVEGGWGYILGSSKTVDCVFVDKEGNNSEYSGRINRIGVDVGYTSAKTMIWSVIAPGTGKSDYPLNGNYVGAAAEVSAVAGLGANVLVGGLHGTIALQPVSVSTITGVNVAAAVQSLTLK